MTEITANVLTPETSNIKVMQQPAALAATAIKKIITKHPITLLDFLLLPCLEKEKPILRVSFAFAAEIPSARFQENESPGIPLRRRGISRFT